MRAYPPDDESYHPIGTDRTMFIDSVDRRVADTIVEHLGATDAMMRVAQLRVFGGAMARAGGGHRIRASTVADHGELRRAL